MTLDNKVWVSTYDSKQLFFNIVILERKEKIEEKIYIKHRNCKYYFQKIMQQEKSQTFALQN